MEEKVLLFHIGTLKTGTTSLQNFLYNNKNNLLKSGWDYPIFENLYFPSYFINGTGLLTSFLKKDEKSFSEYMKIILSSLKNNNVIISQEDFWLLKNMEEFFAEIQKYYRNIKIVVYIRRQDLYLESIYNQFVKSSRHEKREVYQFIEDAEKANFARYLDKLKITDKSKVFHSFRHTFETKAVEKKIPAEYQNAICGWTDQGIGQRLYAHKKDMNIMLEELSKIKTVIS